MSIEDTNTQDRHTNNISIVDTMIEDITRTEALKT